MKKHRLRFFTVLGLTLVALLALVACAIVNATDTAYGVIGGALTVLIPAVIDASAVERRRRAPGKAAVVDDVPSPIHIPPSDLTPG